MDDRVDLEALYALVPAAQEEDLLEEVAAERHRRAYAWPYDHGRCLTCWAVLPGSPDCCAVPEPDDEEPWPEREPDHGPTTPQALALLRDELGAVVVSTETWGVRTPGTSWNR